MPPPSRGRVELRYPVAERVGDLLRGGDDLREVLGHTAVVEARARSGDADRADDRVAMGEDRDRDAADAEVRLLQGAGPPDLPDAREPPSERGGVHDR